MSDEIDQETLDQLHAALKEAKATHISIPIGEHEALMAAAKALHDLIVGNKKGCISRAHKALAAVRAAGIQIEEEG
jgi:hypothetical protein